MLGLVASVSGAACFQPPIEDLKTAASFDLKCPRNEIAVTEIGGWRSQAVVGCGKRARYVHVGDSWVMNTLDGEPTKSK